MACVYRGTCDRINLPLGNEALELYVFREAMKTLTDTEKLRVEALALYEYSKTWRATNYDNIWRKNFKAFKRKMNDGYPLHSKLYIPKIFTNLFVALSQSIDATFSSEDLVSFVPTAKVSLENAKKIEALINFQFKRSKIFWGLYQQFMSAYIYGKGIIKTGWSEDLNCPEFSYVPIWEFFFDPSCGWNLQKAEWCIHRKVMSLHQIKKCVEDGIWKIEDEKALEGLSEGAAPFKDEQTGVLPQDKMGSVDRLKPIEVLECHVGKEIITIVSQKVVVNHVDREGLDIYPFVDLDFSPVIDECIGEGLVGPSRPLQEELNNQRNIIQDIGMQEALGGMIIKGGPEDIDPEEYRFTIDNPVIHVPIGTDVIQRESRTFGGLNRLLETQASANIDEVTATPPIVRGIQEGRGETATGINTRRQTSGKRTGLDIFSIGKCIEKITEQALKFNFFNIKDDSWIDKKTGEEQRISKLDLFESKLYEYVPVCNTSMYEEISKEQAMMLYNLLKNDRNANSRGLLENLLDNFAPQSKSKILLPEQAGMGDMGDMGDVGLLGGQIPSLPGLEPKRLFRPPSPEKLMAG